MKKVQRVEKHVVRPSDLVYDTFMDYCHRAKNLYNHANYIVRQSFINDRLWVRYKELDSILKNDTEYPDYREMPTAKSAQQLLRLLDKNWKSFFASLKDWKENPEKYTGRPKLPKYLKKDGHFQLTLTNQDCKVKDGAITFPKAFGGFTAKPKFLSKPGYAGFQQARVFKEHDIIMLELVYTIREVQEKADNGRYVGIDLGVDNLAAVANNFHAPVFLINGRALKSVNQYYNKKKAALQSQLMKENGHYWSHRMDRLEGKRARKVEDCLHKASRRLVDWCAANNVTTIVIGKNNGWKQHVDLKSKKATQNFVYIPYHAFIEMVTYKAYEYGIHVIVTEESYTSGTSFLDDEQPVKECYDKSRRIHRGLFKSNAGIMVNADINAAYQILKKVIPVKWDRGCVLHPFMVNVA